MRTPYAVTKNGQVRVYDSTAIGEQLRSGGFRFSAWDMSWSAPLSKATAALVISLGAEPRDDAIKAAAGQAEERGTVMYDARAGLAVIRTARPGIIPPAVLRSLPGWRFDDVNGVSTCYPEPVVLETAQRYGVKVTPVARRAIEDRAERIAESSAVTTTASVALTDVLRPYQRAGAAYAARQLKTLNADEMGLGKSLQAIAAAETTGKFPVLVVCPASVRGNWLNEIRKWAPHRTAEVSDGHSVPVADYVIVSYEGLVALAALGARGFAGVIFDEAHAVKQPGSQRTRAAHEVTRVVPGDGLMLFMTGTPMPNGRPEELIEMLCMLGILSDAPGSRMTPAWFRARYCHGGPENMEELARFLRSACMVRRTKAQVLPELPPKQRTDMWVPLDARARELYDSLAREGLERACQSRARALVYFGALRHATGRAKAQAALDWSLDFLAGTTRPLVVFAYHQDVQQSIISGLRDRGYPVTHILGGQSTRATEEHKARFMAGTSRVIVCSLTAANKGHTLTAASDVLMVEQLWVPGDQWQAEDRCHRIGQRNAVTAHYLLAEDTVDPWMFGVVDGKTSVIGTVTDGDDAQPDENGVMGMLLEKQTARYALPATSRAA